MLWLGLTAAFVTFIVGNGVRYVSWPRLVPIDDVLTYEGPGWKSGQHGRGLAMFKATHDRSRVGPRSLPVANKGWAPPDISEKKRMD